MASGDTIEASRLRKIQENKEKLQVCWTVRTLPRKQSSSQVGYCGMYRTIFDGDPAYLRLRTAWRQQQSSVLQALGVKDAARQALEPSENAKQNKQPAKRKRPPPTPASVEKRASQRTKDVVINYNEDQHDHLLRGLPRCVSPQR